MAVTHVTLESVTNQETYIETYEALEDGVAIDFTGATIEFAISDPASTSNILFADTDDGITISTTSFEVRFEESEMNTLCAKSYNVACRYTLDGITTQLFVGILPVVSGGIE